jgi:hypothetical protein
MAEWLGLLLHILEVRGSSLCPEAGYPDRVFVFFLFPSRKMPG